MLPESARRTGAPVPVTKEAAKACAKMRDRALEVLRDFPVPEDVPAQQNAAAFLDAAEASVGQELPGLGGLFDALRADRDGRKLVAEGKFGEALSAARAAWEASDRSPEEAARYVRRCLQVPAPHFRAVAGELSEVLDAAFGGSGDFGAKALRAHVLVRAGHADAPASVEALRAATDEGASPDGVLPPPQAFVALARLYDELGHVRGAGWASESALSFSEGLSDAERIDMTLLLSGVLERVGDDVAAVEVASGLFDVDFDGPYAVPMAVDPRFLCRAAALTARLCGDYVSALKMLEEASRDDAFWTTGAAGEYVKMKEEFARVVGAN